MSQLQYWVWLSMRFGVRPKVKLALVEHFGTPRDVYFATEADYRVRVPLRPEELRMLQDKDLGDANRALAICDREHIRVLTIQDAVYPQRLLQIYDPPLVLYVRGTLPQIDDRAAVAVVGTRSATPYGMRTARKFGSEIVRHGGILLSGLTAGIDRSAAEGALHAGGICVGVSGTAINLDFAGACTQETARCGAVVSDFRRMFPGTLRENIAPEPDIATPEPPPETGSGFAQVRRPVAEKRIDKPQPEAYIDLEAQLKSLTTEQLQIVAAIDAPGTQVDLIIEKTQLPASKVLAELTVLQIRGVVRQEPGKRFSLNVRAGTAQES